MTDRSLFTRIGQVIGTLDYHRPEPARLQALDIDPSLKTSRINH